MLCLLRQFWPILLQGKRLLPTTRPGRIRRMHPAASHGMVRMLDEYRNHPDLLPNEQRREIMESHLLAESAKIVMHDAAHPPPEPKLRCAVFLRAIDGCTHRNKRLRLSQISGPTGSSRRTCQLSFLELVDLQFRLR